MAAVNGAEHESLRADLEAMALDVFAPTAIVDVLTSDAREYVAQIIAARAVHLVVLHGLLPELEAE